MATIYPAQIDNGRTLPTLNNTSTVTPSSVNILRDAIIAIETSLGVKPQGIYATVRARLDVIESLVTGGTGSLNLFGDVTGSLSTTKVVALQGNRVHADILSALTDGYGLTWDNADGYWKASPPPISFTAGGDLSGTNIFQTVIRIQGNPVQPLSLGSNQDGYVLTWINNNNEWEAKPPTSILSDGVVYGFSNTSSDIATYDNLLGADSSSEIDTSVSVNSGSGLTLIQAFATQFDAPNVSVIPAGRWDFDYYTYVGNTGGTSTLTFQVYTRTIGGSETLLFSVTGSPITSTSLTSSTVSFSYPTDTQINTTDRIVVKVLAQTTSVPNRTIHFVFGGTVHASHVHTPLTGAAVQLGGDLTGTTNNATVVRLQNNPVQSGLLGATQDGYVLTWVNADGYWEAKLDTVPAGSVKYYPFLAGVAITNNTSLFVVLGSSEFNPLTQWPGAKSIKLQVLLETTGPTATVRLYNFSSTAVVTGSTLTTSNTSTTLLTTGDLTANLANGSAIYQVQFEMGAGGTGSDFITCSMARFIIQY